MYEIPIKKLMLIMDRARGNLTKEVLLGYYNDVKRD